MITLNATSSPAIGYGHAVRSRHLAAALKRAGIDGATIIDHPGVTAEEVALAKGFTIVLEDAYRGSAAPDIFVDANWHWLAHEFVPPWDHYDTISFTGPRYAILGPEYEFLRPRWPRPRLRRILVTLGGSDPEHATMKLLQQMRLVGGWQRWRWGIVIGPGFEDGDELEHLAREYMGIAVERNVSSMRPLLYWADVVICGGGMTLMEAARCGTPALCVCMGPDQERGLRTLGQRGDVYCLGRPAQLDARQIYALLTNLEAWHVRLWQGRRLSRLIDGQGTRRIVEVVKGCAK